MCCGRPQARQCLCGVADFAFAGQEDQDVAGRFGIQFVDRVDYRLDLIAGLGADDFVVGVVGIAGSSGPACTGTSSGR